MKYAMRQEWLWNVPPDEPTARDGMCVLMNAVLPSKSTDTEETGPPPIRGVAR